ncbi:MAG: prealbumin-like fold domain-containing protein, partial [Anaerolineae bacterium]
VEFNLFNNVPNASFVGGDDDCMTASGSCSAFINADDPGTVNIGASSDFTVSDIDGTFSVATGTESEYSGPAVEKTYVDGSLMWYKVDDSGNPLGGATFEVQRTHDRDGEPVADAPIIVVDNSAPDADPAAGSFYLTGLKLGRYTIQETAAPQGYRGDFLRIETVELTLDNPNATIAEPWVNTAAQGCTPGFWQGGNGAALWDEPSVFDGGLVGDPDWEGFYDQPFSHGTEFNSFFADYDAADGLTMIDIVGTGGGSEDWRKAARDVVAGYLNASWGIAYPYTPAEIAQMWADAVGSGDFAYLHSMLAPANELGCPL